MKHWLTWLTCELKSIGSRSIEELNRQTMQQIRVNNSLFKTRVLHDVERILSSSKRFIEIEEGIKGYNTM